MGFELSRERSERLTALLGRYPTKAAACLPALHLAQEERGCVDADVVAFVANTLDIPIGKVESVAEFYTMYDRRARGRYHLQICTNLSCSLMGAEHLRDVLAKRLGIKVGETTRDGLFTLTEVECLASCGTAPVMRVGDDYHEGLTEETLGKLIDDLHRRAEAG